MAIRSDCSQKGVGAPGTLDPRIQGVPKGNRFGRGQRPGNEGAPRARPSPLENLTFPREIDVLLLGAQARSKRDCHRIRVLGEDGENSRERQSEKLRVAHLGNGYGRRPSDGGS